jgi:hypothetical protein
VRFAQFGTTRGTPELSAAQAPTLEPPFSALPSATSQLLTLVRQGWSEVAPCASWLALDYLLAGHEKSAFVAVSCHGTNDPGDSVGA